jgi:hypothetical protein
MHRRRWITLAGMLSLSLLFTMVLHATTTSLPKIALEKAMLHYDEKGGNIMNLN